MGWASESFANELARYGIYPIEHTNYHISTNSRLKEEKSKPLIKSKQNEKFNNITIHFVKYGKDNHIATFNMSIDNLITIKYIRLFKNKNEYYLSFPQIKCGDKYLNTMTVNKELYNQILQDCIELIKKGD